MLRSTAVSDELLPYARPKIGRRASDRQFLKEWYARFVRPSQPLDGEPADAPPARLFWHEPEMADVGEPAKGPDRPERRSFFR